MLSLLQPVAVDWGDGYVTTTTWKSIPAAPESSSPGIPHVPPRPGAPSPAARPAEREKGGIPE